MKWDILKQPYPFDDSKNRIIISAIGFGLFIFAFLAFFQPFGLNNYNSPSKIWELAGFGMITTGCLLMNNLSFPLLFPSWYNQSSWTVGKNIMYTLWMFFTIGLGNMLYAVYRNYLDFSLEGFLFYQMMTVLVGVFPVVFSTFLVYHRRMEKMVKEARSLNDTIGKDHLPQENLIQLPSTNKSEELTVAQNELLMIKAIENYIEVYSESNGTINKQVIRSTLKSASEALRNFPDIQKCHRSYLVNLQKIDHFEGNAQGLTLTFGSNSELNAPVSRSFVKPIRDQLTEN